MRPEVCAISHRAGPPASWETLSRPERSTEVTYRLHIDEHGAGPEVVLLHGAPSSPDDFAPLVEALEASHRVLVPHLPGYGRTPSDPGAYSLDSVVALLERGLESRGVSRAD